MKRTRRPVACVIGDMDLVRPLGLAGIRCAVVTRPRNPARYSRFAAAAVDWLDSQRRGDELLDRLCAFGWSLDRPVLFYQADQELLFVSRHRDRLAGAFRFLLPPHEQVETLVDKGRFLEQCARLELPAPRTLSLDLGSPLPAPSELIEFPCILKPLTRRKESWEPVAGHRKALEVSGYRALAELWPRLAEGGGRVLLQELVPGSETSIESYHVYRTAGGEIAGEFTGRKIRTYPRRYGHSTAVEITRAPDVLRLGRELTERLDLVGVAKFDFKRAPSGGLLLLEVNPRFNLWHHPGALAGVNLPALVFADLTGRPRPPVREPKPGVAWCRIWRDYPAARAWEVSLFAWLAWAWRCPAKSAIAWDDPMPFLRGLCGSLLPGGRRPVET